MARLRVQLLQDDGVRPPAELLDHLSPVWRSAAATDRWWRQHFGVSAPAEVDTTEWGRPSWVTRFAPAAAAWAVHAGIADSDPNGSIETRRRLAALGVHRPSTLERGAVSKGVDDYCSHVKAAI